MHVRASASSGLLDSRLSVRVRVWMFCVIYYAFNAYESVHYASYAVAYAHMQYELRLTCI